ncbi:hypothetical protein LI177_00440 [bacterium 210820-DFI.6.37]|nr:hypothetical protein [bacterium 210820-DFI.6.37]
MTKLDELIEQIQSDSNANESMNGLLDKLVKARDTMQDPTDADAAEQLLTEVLKEYLGGALGDISEENADPEYMEKTSAAVEEAFTSQGWSNFSKRSRRNDLMQYELGFNIENTSIRVSVFVEDLPKRIRIHATLPFVGEKTYEYLLSRAIVDANKRFIYGAFSYDQNDGEITYDYSYPITHGFFQDDFLRILHAVIRTSVDDEAFSAIKKAAQGRYKRTEREDILKSLAPLVEDLTD